MEFESTLTQSQYTLPLIPHHDFLWADIDCKKLSQFSDPIQLASEFETLPLLKKEDDYNSLRIEPPINKRGIRSGEHCPKSFIDEDRQMKRQQRLIKNRESAQLSRLRKKQYVDDLEAKVASLTSHNTTLQDSLEKANERNKELMEEIEMLRKQLRSKEGEPTSPFAQ